MFQNNKLFIDGERQREEMRRSLTNNDIQRRDNAILFFQDHENLRQAIAEQVLPTIAILNRADGTIGTGFYQHPTWLVSNAHVAPSADQLLGLQLSDWQNRVSPLEVMQSFHRPYDRHTMPDLVLINVTDNPAETHAALNVWFSDNEGLEKTLIFYIDHHLEIKFLRKASPEGSYPFIYDCLDGSTPLPGVSGSPIIEARVVIGRTPRWEFKVVGALYARCLPAESLLSSQGAFKNKSESSMQVCAIPVAQDFDHLLRAFNALSAAAREHDLAAASATFTDKQGTKDVIRYSSSAAINEQIAAAGFYQYAYGDSPLLITLPEGLEPLWGDGVMPIEESLMIRSKLQAAIGKKYRDPKYQSMFKAVPDVSKSELQTSYQKFLIEINEMISVEFCVTDNLIISQDGLFRIDCAGGDAYWKLELQDNTNIEQKIHGKPVSSIFAIIKFQRETISISGEKLSLLIQQSQNDRTEKFDDFFSLVMSVSKKVTKGNQHRSKR